MGRMSDVDIDVRELLEQEMNSIVNNEYEREEYIRLNYERIGTEVLKRTTNAARRKRRLRWYDDIEKVLDEYTNSNIDSAECMLQLSNLGYSPQEIIEEIMHDVVPIASETDT